MDLCRLSCLASDIAGRPLPLPPTTPLPSLPALPPNTTTYQHSTTELTPGTFTILAYTNDSPDAPVPATWGDADPHLIDRGKVEQVRLRSFSTNVHSLEAMVAYRVGE